MSEIVYQCRDCGFKGNELIYRGHVWYCQAQCSDCGKMYRRMMGHQCSWSSLFYRWFLRFLVVS